MNNVQQYFIKKDNNLKNLNTIELEIYDSDNNLLNTNMYSKNNFLKPGQTYFIKPNKKSIHFKNQYKFNLDKVSLKDSFQEAYYNINSSLWAGIPDFSKKDKSNNYIICKLFKIEADDIPNEIDYEVTNLVDNNLYVGEGTKFNFKANKNSRMFKQENESFSFTWSKIKDPKTFFQSFFFMNNFKNSDYNDLTANIKFVLNNKSITGNQQIGLKTSLNNKTIIADISTLKDEKTIVEGTKLTINIPETDFYFKSGSYNITIW